MSQTLFKLIGMHVANLKSHNVRNPVSVSCSVVLAIRVSSIPGLWAFYSSLIGALKVLLEKSHSNIAGTGLGFWACGWGIGAYLVAEVPRPKTYTFVLWV